MPRQKFDLLNQDSRDRLDSRLRHLMQAADIRTMEQIAEKCDFHGSTLSKYLNGKLGPPPQRILELAAVELFLLSRRDAANSERQLEVGNSWLNDASRTGSLRPDEIRGIIASRIAKLREAESPNAQVPEEHLHGEALEDRLLRDSNELINDRIEMTCQAESQRHPPLPLVIAFNSGWEEDSSVQSTETMLDPTHPLGKETVDWMSSFLRNYTNLTIWGLFIAGESAASRVRTSLGKCYLDVLKHLKDKLTEKGEPEKRLLFYLGVRSSYSALADYWTVLPARSTGPQGPWAFGAFPHEKRLQEALAAGEKNDLWARSTMAVPFDEVRTQRVLDYFGIRYSGRRAAWELTSRLLKWSRASADLQNQCIEWIDVPEAVTAGK